MSALTDRLEQLANDWDANGNSRPLGDPTAATWHDAARQLRNEIRGERDVPVSGFGR